jgi:signal transduction histidine kinase
VATSSGAGTTVAALGQGELDTDDAWWQRTVPWWHVAFALTVAMTAAVVLVDGTSATVLVPLSLLGIAYPALGAPALRRDVPVRGAAYLLVAAVLLAWTVHLHPAGMLLLLCLYPQSFAILGRLPIAACAVVLFTFTGCAALAGRDGWTRDAVTSAAITGLINMTIALALGAFVDRLLRESRRRSELVRALSSAQQDLAAAHHDAGVRAERERLAREIHDTLAQGFTSIVVLARAIEAELGPQHDEALLEKVRLLEDTAQTNLTEARALVAALPPADLTDGGLLPALQRAADRCARETGVDATLSVVGTRRALASSYDVVLLRSAQEALTNVARHARARQVRLTLAYGTSDVALTVEDDGVGLTPRAAEEPGGFGLAGMRKRVEEAGGRLALHSAPGGGTTVTVVLP